MKRKYPSVKDAPIEELVFDLVCDGIAEGDPSSEQFLITMNPQQGHSIAAHVRFLMNGPKGLLPSRTGGGWPFTGQYAGPRLRLLTMSDDGVFTDRHGAIITWEGAARGR